MKKAAPILLLLISAMFLVGCIGPKEYEKMYINDRDMALSSDKMSVFETTFQSYREGAAGADGGKSGGGCGCN